MKPEEIIKHLLADKRPEARVMLNWIRRGVKGEALRIALAKVEGRAGT